jgi:hypothetical protein
MRSLHVAPKPSFVAVALGSSHQAGGDGFGDLLAERPWLALSRNARRLSAVGVSHMAGWRALADDVSPNPLPASVTARPDTA